MHEPLFSSYVLGGFECAHVLTREHKRLDMLRDTQHDTRCDEDYSLLAELGITAVREGFAWHEIDRGGGSYNFARFIPMMEAAKRHKIQQIWDLTHFDVPEDVDPWGDEIVRRFVDYSLACLRTIRQFTPETIYLCPVNEIGFFAYMGGATGHWAPFGISRSTEWMKQLVRMTIGSMDAIRAADTNVRFIQVDPHMHRKLKHRSPITEGFAKMFDEYKYLPFDMLTGRRHPELGGHERYLDIIGVNYYPSSQEFYTEDNLDPSSFETIDFLSPDWTPLSEMMREMFERYNRPIVISETGAWGTLRPDWWKMVFEEVEKVREMDIPLLGVCAYPVIDRPDWHDGHLTNSGFWDYEDGDPSCRRLPHDETLDIVRKYVALHTTKRREN